MVWLYLIFGAVVLAAFRREGFAETRLLQKSPAKAPNIGALDFTDPDALMDAAKQAQESGYVESAKALASKAQDVADIVKAINGANVPIKSPLPGVNDAHWTAFTNLFRGKDIAEISPAFHLGLFNIGFLRLRDLGLADDVKQQEYNGRRVWQGKLKPPLTVKAFLANPAVQYQVFARDMRDRADFIRTNYMDYVGKDIEGQKATLSGLLAAVKLAGTKGFDSWVKRATERKKFENTTKGYLAANGIF